jgi:hypothetical protein
MTASVYLADTFGSMILRDLGIECGYGKVAIDAIL